MDLEIRADRLGIYAADNTDAITKAQEKPRRYRAILANAYIPALPPRHVHPNIMGIHLSDPLQPRRIAGAPGAIEPPGPMSDPPIQEIDMSPQNKCEVLFPVKSGIFGVGRLATRLTALTASRQIGAWHIGRWLDWKHTAIRISFATPADAALAISVSPEAVDLPSRDTVAAALSDQKEPDARSSPVPPLRY